MEDFVGFAYEASLGWDAGLSRSDESGNDCNEQSELNSRRNSEEDGGEEPRSESDEFQEEADSATEGGDANYPQLGLDHIVIEYN